MALFGKKKETAKVTDVAVVEKKKVSAPALPQRHDMTSVIMKPRVSEKAALMTDQNVYTFEVRKGATKHEIRDAVKKLYNVTPIKVNVVNKVPRHSMSRARGRMMMEAGMRKAYVYLKKGDRIELI